jgi:hypothetical protein
MNRCISNSPADFKEGRKKEKISRRRREVNMSDE